jgi:ribonucleotide reductase, class II
MNTPNNTAAPAAFPVFFRTYSRMTPAGRESWEEVTTRTVNGLAKLGKLSAEEVELIHSMQSSFKCLPSGRWLWVGGTPWIEQPENYSGAYNCTSTNLYDWKSFALMMDLAMMGSGTGAVIEPCYIENLKPIRNKIRINSVSELGTKPKDERKENSSLVSEEDGTWKIIVGDSRNGWVAAYYLLLCLSTLQLKNSKTKAIVDIDLSNVRPAGEKLVGFGGTANPVQLPNLFHRVASILSNAAGRKLTSVECCLLIDEAAKTVVAGNIRRSAGMRQFSSSDVEAESAKDNLWSQSESGQWVIDPERDALRMANHTRVFHRKPTRQEVLDSVTKQFYSGEGAIQFAPEAIARANADVLSSASSRNSFIDTYCDQGPETALRILSFKMFDYQEPTPEADEELNHRISRYGLNPCGEIIGSDFHCNLSEVHLNLLDPNDIDEQLKAFTAAAISVASLLHHDFIHDRYRLSRELDPIVGVSFTGLFDFFVAAFGVEWLEWWAEGRPVTPQGLRFKAREAEYLSMWKDAVHDAVWAYCDGHSLRCPNRCTTVQPAGTKSLLTGASPGWHPPKAQRFIRRITFRRDDPVALACIDYGYNVIPSQSDKDENGALLDDPFDPRCTEWLVEIPTEVPWASLEGADSVEISKFSAAAQFDFYMQVQTFYTTHNTSATIEFRESEIEELSDLIYDAIDGNKGYISAALLARFDANETFPRLPFEPIDREKFEHLQSEVRQRHSANGGLEFSEYLRRHDTGQLVEAGPAGCDGDKCLFPSAK